MSIAFTPERWEKTKHDAHLWWDGKLDRPLLCLTAWGRPPDRPPARLPFYHRTAHYDPAVSAEEVVDVWDYHLSSRRFLGDAFPACWPNFGPGATAAFLGAETHVDPNTVWFHPASACRCAICASGWTGSTPGCGASKRSTGRPCLAGRVRCFWR